MSPRLAMIRLAAPCARPTAPSADETIRAYNRVAGEYAYREHETTRALEEATRCALRTAMTQHPVRPTSILEVGAGAGSSTGELRRLFPRRPIVATDASPAMAAVGQAALIDQAVLWRVATAAAAIPTAIPGDLVVAGLADPFLHTSTLNSVPSGVTAFVTVPTRQWAVRERTYRLHLPIDRTRFRLLDGRAVEAASFVFDASELACLAETASLRIHGGGTVQLAAPRGRPAPEISWLLATRE